MIPRTLRINWNNYFPWFGKYTYVNTSNEILNSAARMVWKGHCTLETLSLEFLKNKNYRVGKDRMSHFDQPPSSCTIFGAAVSIILNNLMSPINCIFTQSSLIYEWFIVASVPYKSRIYCFCSFVIQFTTFTALCHIFFL